MSTSQSCPWCHRTCDIIAFARNYCEACGHATDRPRVECDCPSCRAIPEKIVECILRRQREAAAAGNQKLLAAKLLDARVTHSPGPWHAAEELSDGAMGHAHRRVLTPADAIVPGVMIECVRRVSDLNADNIALMLASPALLQDVLRLSRLALALTEMMSITARQQLLDALMSQAIAVRDRYESFLAE